MRRQNKRWQTIKARADLKLETEDTRGIDMTEIKLRPFLRRPLDVLFIALNPPQQSNLNGHYFSGKRSRLFKLLAASRLITREIPRACADEIVFGSTEINYARSSFGVVDLVDDLVETNSTRVRVTPAHVARLINRVREIHPRFACVIHSKVRDGLMRHGKLRSPLKYGWCGAVLRDCATEFLLNYFPNGNSVTDETKIHIFRLLRDRLRVRGVVGVLG
jgi:hypothetical protein